MRRFFILLCPLLLLLPMPVRADGLNPADREVIVSAVAASYPDTGFAGRVGICAVILNRMADDGFPDTAASVIGSFGGGCFEEYHTPCEKLLRLTNDALLSAQSGADPTDGALYFTVLAGTGPVYDFRFDNSGEKKQRLIVEEAALSCTAVIDGIGFRR